MCRLRLPLTAENVLWPVTDWPGRFGNCSVATALFRNEGSDRLYQGAQHLSDAPGLGDTAARGEGRLGVENLAYRANAGLGEVRFETIEKMPRRLVIVGMHLEPGVDERADQPCPDGAL